MSLLGLCQSISFIQYETAKNYQKPLYEILESVFSFLVLFVIFSLALLLCHTERKRSIYVFGILSFLFFLLLLFFFHKGEGFEFASVD